MVARKLVASSFTNNTSLKSVCMWAANEEKTFYHDLITSLPLNRFIEKTIINAAHFDVAGLLENIARQNKAVKEVICLGENFYLNENDIQML